MRRIRYGVLCLVLVGSLLATLGTACARREHHVYRERQYSNEPRPAPQTERQRQEQKTSDEYEMVSPG